MTRSITTLILVAWCFSAFAQYPIGHRQISYQDPARSNRNVPFEVYYPATTAGDNTAFATGTFPLIVFGHGFVMGYDAYLFWKNNLVPEGYIIAFPTTEGSMSPSHENFGADLAFLINKIKDEAATNASSPFYQKLSATSAIMGHSMGGGSSFLACAGNNVPTCMVTFAAAETNPSSTTAAGSINIPCMVMSGAEDCVAPPASHQIPMYNALSSPCKVYVSIIEGVHCYFGDYNFNCTFGESTCNPVPSIQRADQEDVALDFTLLYLDYYLKNDAVAWTAFNDSLTSSSRITYQMSCPSTSIEENDPKNELMVYPNPATSEIVVVAGSGVNGEIRLEIYDLSGRMIYSSSDKADGINGIRIGTNDMEKGTYLIRLETSDGLYRQGRFSIH